MLAIREARADEWRAWRALRLRALADSPDAFGEVLAEVRDKPDADWQRFTAPRRDAVRLFALQGDQPVGMCVLVIGGARPDGTRSFDLDTRKAKLFAMWVAPEARGSGAGRALVEAALAWGRARGALEVALRVAESQTAARRMYARCGFRDAGERKSIRPSADIPAVTLVATLPPLVMGVVNVTPDSFSDGGTYLDPEAAVAHGLQLIADGADILDLGGEATNPRATPVSAAEELRRVLPVVERLAGRATLSIDTTKAEVARAAVAAGATIINDVSGGLFDVEMASAVTEIAADHDVTYIVGHLRGRSLPEVFAAEGSVSWQVVAAELADRSRAFAQDAGAGAGPRLWLDPGIGFGKGADPEGNVALLRHAGDIASTIGRPIVVGPSRKRFLRRLLGVQDPTTEVLDAASVLASLAAVRAGAQVVRVHNVALLRTALTAYNKE